MKVLVVAAPLVGHLTPLLPLSGALRAAGHEVLLATGGDALGMQTDGLRARDVLGRVSMGRLAGPVALRNPNLIVRELTGRAGTRMVGALFGAVNARMLPGLLELGRQWRPDLVLHESLAASGAIVAAVLGVPAVLQESNLFDATELLAVTLADRTLGRAAADGCGPIEPAAVRTAVVIRTAPAGLVGERPGPRMRAVPGSGAGALPDWLDRPGDRPRVLVSRSTLAGSGGDPTARVIAAAGSVDAEFVLLRGQQSRWARRRALPDNVRAVGWIPLDRALRHADALVHHGGAGSLLQALDAGVAQLMVPGAGDRRHNAELVAARGAGLAVPARRIDAATLTRLVGDPALRRAAGELRAEIAAMPDPSTVLPVLETLVEG